MILINKKKGTAFLILSPFYFTGGII